MHSPGAAPLYMVGKFLKITWWVQVLQELIVQEEFCMYVFLWNKTFNDKWGMELLLPARGHLRYNFSTSSMLQVGFELEGNQFWMNLANSPKGEIYLQRGELKPRLMWDRKLAGFIWFNAQAGLRYNWRFDGMNQYNGSKDNERYFMSSLGNPLYFSFSLSFVSP